MMSWAGLFSGGVLSANLRRSLAAYAAAQSKRCR